MSKEGERKISPEEGLLKIERLLQSYQSIVPEYDQLRQALNSEPNYYSSEAQKWPREKRWGIEKKMGRSGSLNVQRHDLERQTQQELVSFVEEMTGGIKPNERMEFQLNDQDKVIAAFPDFIADFLRYNIKEGYQNEAFIGRWSHELVFGIGAEREIVVYLSPDGSAEGNNCLHWFGTIGGLDKKYRAQQDKYGRWDFDEKAAITLERLRIFTTIARVIYEQGRPLTEAKPS